jgi:hypothetical protein
MNTIAESSRPELLRELATSPRPGWETVWGYLWRTEAHSLALMLDSIRGLETENAKAWELCEARGIKPASVIVPGRGQGVHPVGAFPPAILSAVFPISP